MNPISWLREHPRVAVAGGVAGALVAGFGAGRFAAPTKTVTKVETKIETVEVVKWKDRVVTEKGPVVVREHRVEVPGPAGPTVTVDRIVEREKVVTVHDTQGTDTAATSTEKVVEKLVERDAPRVALFATAGLPFSGTGIAPVQYGLTATARVLGPLSVLAGGSGGPGGGQAVVGVGIAF